MTQIKWNQLFKRIPTQIKIKGHTWEVLWSPTIVQDEHVMGETRFNPNQIIIKTGQTPKESVHTYIHEVLHAIDHVYGIGLTERQVILLESALSVVLKPFSIFKE